MPELRELATAYEKLRGKPAEREIKKKLLEKLFEVEEGKAISAKDILDVEAKLKDWSKTDKGSKETLAPTQAEMIQKLLGIKDNESQYTKTTPKDIAAILVKNGLRTNVDEKTHSKKPTAAEEKPKEDATAADKPTHRKKMIEANQELQETRKAQEEAQKKKEKCQEEFDKAAKERDPKKREEAFKKLTEARFDSNTAGSKHFATRKAFFTKLLSYGEGEGPASEANIKKFIEEMQAYTIASGGKKIGMWRKDDLKAVEQFNTEHFNRAADLSAAMTELQKLDLKLDIDFKNIKYNVLQDALIRGMSVPVEFKGTGGIDPNKKQKKVSFEVDPRDIGQLPVPSTNAKIRAPGKDTDPVAL